MLLTDEDPSPSDAIEEEDEDDPTFSDELAAELAALLTDCSPILPSDEELSDEALLSWDDVSDEVAEESELLEEDSSDDCDELLFDEFPSDETLDVDEATLLVDELTEDDVLLTEEPIDDEEFCEDACEEDDAK